MAELAKGPQRYKDLFSDKTMTDVGKVMLQRECFQNGSPCAKTISTWRRNAELFTAHHYMMNKDPFNLPPVEVAAYVAECGMHTKTGCSTVVSAIRWVEKVFDTLVWTTNSLISAQVKRGAPAGFGGFPAWLESPQRNH